MRSVEPSVWGRGPHCPPPPRQRPLNSGVETRAPEPRDGCLPAVRRRTTAARGEEGGGATVFSRQLPGCVCRWLPVGARAPQYCSMKQRRRGRPGFWLAVYVACTVLFCIITDSLRQAVVRQSQEGSWAVPGSAKGCVLTAACGGRGAVREAVCVYPGLRGPERVCHLFCILSLVELHY